MEVNDLHQGIDDNSLKAVFTIKYHASSFHKVCSSPYKFSDATFEVQVIVMTQMENLVYGVHKRHHLIFIRFHKQRHDKSNYSLQLSCKTFSLSKLKFKSDYGYWRLIHEYLTNTPRLEAPEFSFGITAKVTVEREDNTGAFSNMFGDIDLTDFEVRGTDGSVPFHKVVLAACSDVFKCTVTREFVEKKQGYVSIPFSVATLRHLKNYMYLHEIPASNAGGHLEELLLLASQYMMPQLEQKCIDKIILGINSDNAESMLNFAVLRNMDKLKYAVLKCFETGVVKVAHLNTGKRQGSAEESAVATKKKKSRRSPRITVKIL